jgi:hypothetical protein
MYLFGLLCIAFFLFVIHSKFLHDIDPQKNSDLFIFFGYDFKQLIPYIFGAAFAIVTTIIIALIDRKQRLFYYFAIIAAAFEMLGIFLYHNTELSDRFFISMSSGYYALYTGFIIFMYAYISQGNINEIEKELKLIEENKPAIEEEKINIEVKELIIEEDEVNKDQVEKKLKPEYIEAIKLLQEGMSGVDVSTATGIHTSTISRLKKEHLNKLK